MADTPQPDLPEEATTTPTPPAPRRPRRALVWGLVGAAALAATLLVGGSALTGWVVGTQAGSNWLLRQVPGLQVEGLQGTLGGTTLVVKRLRYTLSGAKLQVEDAQLSGMAWRWRPHPGAWFELTLDTLQAARVQWQSGPSSPSTEPTSLRLPLALTVRAARIGQVQVDTAPALTDLQAALQLGADGGASHRVQDLRFRFDRFDATAALRIATDAPLTLAADAHLQSLPDAAQPWQADLHGAGPLAALETRAHLSGSAARGQPTQALDASATLHPFAAWPLGRLNLRTEALDLSALHSAAPRTRLSGNAQLDSEGLRQPMQLAVQLDNTAAGRWDQGDLPLHHLQLQAHGTPGQAKDGGLLERLSLTQFVADLGATGPAAAQGGQLTGNGEWWREGGQGQARLSLQLNQVQPAALDQRLAAMTLSGPVKATLTGLPTPALLQGAATPASAPAPAAHPQLALDATLRGKLNKAAGGSPEVALRLDALLDAHHLLLRQAQAQAAGAVASLQGQAERVDASRWRWQLTGALQDFDPVAWWPGPPGSAWRNGPHRLNAQLDSQGSTAWPPRPATGTPDTAADLAALWRQFSGRLALTLGPSQLAGVPVQGKLLLDSGAASPLTSQWQAGGNSLSLEGRGEAGHLPDHWQLALQAPTLATLAPLWALDPGRRP